MALSVEQLRARFEEAGLLTASEADEALDALRRPGRTLKPPIMVAAWGRKPS